MTMRTIAISILALAAAATAHIASGRDTFSLNGKWAAAEEAAGGDAAPEFASPAGDAAGFWKKDFDSAKWKSVNVPMKWDSAIRGVNWFRKDFTPPKTFKGGRILLKFTKITYVAWIWVNGRAVHDGSLVDAKYGDASHQGTVTGCEYDITESVDFAGPNNITVKLFYPKSVQAYGALFSGMDGVELEAVPALRMEHALITPDIDAGVLNVKASVVNAGGSPCEFSMDYAVSGKRGTESGAATKAGLEAGERRTFDIAIKVAKDKIGLWSPQTPDVSSLTLALKDGGRIIDSRTERFGWRKFEIAGRKFMLNGNPFFIRGWSIVGANWGSKDEKLELAKKANVNFIRHHASITTDGFFTTADEKGMPIAEEIGSTPGAFWKKYGLDEYYNCLYREIPKWMEERWNHPCIVMYSMLNEPWMSPVENIAKTYDIAKAADRSRVIMTAAGGTKFTIGGMTKEEYKGLRTDVDDIHCYHGWYEKPILFMRDWIDFYEKNRMGAQRPFMNTESVGRYAMGWGEQLKSGPWPRWLGERILEMEGKSNEIKTLTFKKQAEAIKISAEMWRSRKGVVSGAWIFTWWMPDNFEVVRKAFSPIHVCAAFDDVNLFQGDSAKFPVHAINDENRIMKDVKVELSVTKAGGAAPAFTRSYGFGDIGEDGIKTVEGGFECASDWPAGAYKLNLTLYESGRKTVENDYGFTVHPKQLCALSIQTRKRALLLDSDGRTANVLESLGVKFERRQSLGKDDALDCDAIIVGAGFSGEIKSDRAAAWVKDGGRVVILERMDFKNVKQLLPKELPLNHQYGPMNDPLNGQFNSFVDVTKPGHPVFAGLKPAQFEDWNGNYHVMTNGLLRPFDKLLPYTLAQVRSAGHWNGESAPGSAVLDMSVGKGGILVSQLLAVDRWRKDPVATQYLFNVFNYTLAQDVCAGAEYDPKAAAQSIGPGPFATDADGFIHHWLTCGPFPNPGGRPHHPRDIALKNQKGYDADPFIKEGGAVWVEKGEQDLEPVEGNTHETVFPKTPEGYWGLSSPMKATCKWTSYASKTACIMMNSFTPGENILGYAACYVESPSARKAKVKVGSDDGYKLWINHKFIGGLCDFRGVTPDSEEYGVALQAGVNPVLIKIVQDSNGMGFCLRFTDMDNAPLKDLKIWLVPKQR